MTLQAKIDRLPRQRILAAAEHLFAYQGFAGTSIRAITKEAKVSLASAHYYFGSKDELIREVFARRIGPLNEERLERLEACLHSVREGERPPLRGVVEAYLCPALRCAPEPDCEREVFRRLMGRAHSEPGGVVAQIVQKLFRETQNRFRSALGRALPEASQDQIRWRMQFMLGAMSLTMAGFHRLREGVGDVSKVSEIEDVLSELISFVVSGFQACDPEA